MKNPEKRCDGNDCPNDKCGCVEHEIEPFPGVNVENHIFCAIVKQKNGEGEEQNVIKNKNGLSYSRRESINKYLGLNMLVVMDCGTGPDESSPCEQVDGELKYPVTGTFPKPSHKDGIKGYENGSGNKNRGDVLFDNNKFLLYFEEFFFHREFVMRGAGRAQGVPPP